MRTKAFFCYSSRHLIRLLRSLAVVVGLSFSVLAAAEPKAPPNSYVVKLDCPEQESFKNKRSFDYFESPEALKPLGKIQAGEIIRYLGEDQHFTPGKLRVAYDHANFKKGDIAHEGK